MHTPFDLVDASEPIDQYEYLGWNEACTEVLMLPGESATFWVEVEGSMDIGPYCFVGRGQVTAVRDQFHVRATDTAGTVLVDADLDGPRAVWRVGPGC
jgi:hypothetical protein